MFIHRRDGEPLAFAGLWETWRDPGRPGCAVGRLVRDRHDAGERRARADPRPDAGRARRRRVGRPGSIPREHDLDALAPLLAPAPSEWFEVFPVSTLVNKAANNGPELVTPVEPETLLPIGWRDGLSGRRSEPAPPRLVASATRGRARRPRFRRVPSGTCTSWCCTPGPRTGGRRRWWRPAPPATPRPTWGRCPSERDGIFDWFEEGAARFARRAREHRPGDAGLVVGERPARPVLVPPDGPRDRGARLGRRRRGRCARQRDPGRARRRRDRRAARERPVHARVPTRDRCRCAGPGETIHLHATDTDGEWLIRLTPDGIETSREHAKGDVAARGPASDLFLFLVGRVPPERARGVRRRRAARALAARVQLLDRPTLEDSLDGVRKRSQDGSSALRSTSITCSRRSLSIAGESGSSSSSDVTSGASDRYESTAPYPVSRSWRAS